MFTNMQRRMLRHVLLLYHWLQNFVNSVTTDRRLRSHRGIRRQSSGASCEFTHRRRDATGWFRRVGVGGVYWAGISPRRQLVDMEVVSQYIERAGVNLGPGPVRRDSQV